MLYAWSEKDAAPGVDSVVGLDDIFAAVIQFAVAEEEAQAAIGEVNLVLPGNCVGDAGDAGAILFPAPPRAIRAQPSGKCLIDFGISERQRCGNLRKEAISLPCELTIVNSRN
jgi:hypothetical protein